jgi:transcriptional regulator with XRE-family HTH domain
LLYDTKCLFSDRYLLRISALKKSIIGQNIRFLRKSRGLSQRALADDLGLKRNNIASYEAGIVEPRAATFVRIAEYFGIEAQDLLVTTLRDRPDLVRNATPQPKRGHSPNEINDQLHHLERRTIDMEKVLIGFREFYRQRQHQGSAKASVQDTDSDMDRLIDMLEDLLHTNRDFIDQQLEDQNPG